MNWRERIQRARENGGVFTEEDREAWRDPKTCLVGETLANLGASTDKFLILDIACDQEIEKTRFLLGEMTPEHWVGVFQYLATAQITEYPVKWRERSQAGDPDRLERLLELCEDIALRMKREGRL